MRDPYPFKQGLPTAQPPLPQGITQPWPADEADSPFDASDPSLVWIDVP